MTSQEPGPRQFAHYKLPDGTEYWRAGKLALTRFPGDARDHWHNVFTGEVVTVLAIRAEDVEAFKLSADTQTPVDFTYLYRVNV